jgi:geranylgeranylglycerol-phosphate geranylgeranyltransferase
MVISGTPPSGAVHPWLRLVRIGNTSVSFAGTIVGGLAAAGTGLLHPWGSWLDLLLAAGSTACVTAAGNALNDVGDRESDRRNHPDRPLVTGELSVASARASVAILLVAAVALVAPQLGQHPALGAILAVAIGVLLAYELKFKAIGLVGNLEVALLTGLVFLYGAAAVGSLLPTLSLGAMAFFATASREVIKDMEDAAGDTDRSTFPRTHGPRASTLLARGLVGAALLLSPVPLLVLVPVASIAGIMYLAFVLVADGLFVLSVVHLPEKLHGEQSQSKLAMAVSLLAFVALAFR